MLLLINDISGFRSYVQISQSFTFDDIKNLMINTTKKRILPFLGLTLYQEIAQAEEPNELKENLKNALAHYTLAALIRQTNFIVSPIGNRQYNDEKSNAANDITTEKGIIEAVENAEFFLNLAINEASTKTNFKPSQQAGSKFFTTALDLSNYLNCEDWKTFFAMSKYLREIENNDLENLLGSNLEILQNILNKSEQTNIDKKLIEHAKRYTATAALATAIPYLSLRMSANGFEVTSVNEFLKRDTLKSKEHRDQIKDLQNTATTDAEKHARKLLEFLAQNFPTAAAPTTTANTPISTGYGGILY